MTWQGWRDSQGLNIWIQSECQSLLYTYRLKQDIYRTTRIKHAEVIQQEDIFRLYAVLFNLLIKMHTKGSQASQRFAQCMVSQDQAYRKDLWAPPCGSNCNYFISDKRYEWFCFKFYIQTFFSSAGVINWSLINPEQTLHHRLVRQTHHSHVYVSLHLQKLTLNVKNSFVAFKFKGQERKNLNMLRKACLLIFIKLNHVKGQQHKTNT